MGSRKACVIRTEHGGTGDGGLCVIFLVKLPFRIPLGRCVSFSDRIEKHKGTTWILNKTDVDPREKPPNEFGRLNASDFYSYAAVSVWHADKPRSEAEVLARRVESDGSLPELEGVHLDAIAHKLLRRFLVALDATHPGRISGPTWFGVVPDLTFHEFLQGTLYQYPCVVLGGTSVPDSSVQRLASVRIPAEPMGRWGGGGDRIEEAGVRELQDFLDQRADRYYYELGHKGVVSALAGDYRSALLWEAIAVETVLTLAYEKWLGTSLASPLLSRKLHKSLQKEVPKELGLTLLMKLLPLVLLRPQDRPSEQMVREAISAVRLRNKLVHSGRTSGGDYHVNQLTDIDLGKARAALSRLRAHLSPIVEA